jgi:signal transduction histidine kinase
MLEMAAEGARTNAIVRNVDLKVSRPEEPVLVRCDRDRMLRALAHVLDNAVRFAPDGSSVELGVREESGDVWFSITDHGPGLSEETRANLFDRTWHAKRADRVGAGLGLAIVRGFLDAHGGRLEVASSPGSPTMFSLILPKDARPSYPPPSSEPDEQPPRS